MQLTALCRIVLCWGVAVGVAVDVAAVGVATVAVAAVAWLCWPRNSRVWPSVGIDCRDVPLLACGGLDSFCTEDSGSESGDEMECLSPISCKVCTNSCKHIKYHDFSDQSDSCMHRKWLNYLDTHW